MNTILFDLDGTLLPVDLEEFTHAYFTLLSKKLSNHINPNKVPELIWASTKYMISNLDNNKINMEAFFEDFQTRIDNNLEELHPILNEFYKEDFKELKSIVYPNQLASEIITILKEKKYDIVLATNPLFPKQATHHRIEWAGLNKDDFKLITTYENTHFCKPNLEYYTEILELINRKNSDVMMIGNDVQEDIIASKLGIKTYLLNNYKIDRKKGNIVPDYEGSFEDLYEFVKELPSAAF